MPRVAEARDAAEPSSAEQRARFARMLDAAAQLGAEKDLERVQMHEVAKLAGVAIGTLYRYFPSKTHLFVAVMVDQIDQMSEGFAVARNRRRPRRTRSSRPCCGPRGRCCAGPCWRTR